MDLSPVTVPGPFKGTLPDKHLVKKSLLAILLKAMHTLIPSSKLT